MTEIARGNGAAVALRGPSPAAVRRRDDLTFKANLQRTRYGWLRLTPAYSVHLVARILDAESDRLGGSPDVLDPFCGTGTTALLCAERGLRATTTDINPFLLWLARAKCAAYAADDLARFRRAAVGVGAAIADAGGSPGWVPDLFRIDRWWEPATLAALARLKGGIEIARSDLPAGVADLLDLAFCRVMIGSAHVSFGHQSMSFRRPPGESAGPGLFAADPPDGLVSAWDAAVRDLAESAASPVLTTPVVVPCDARRLTDALPAGEYDLVVTSPPYPNRMSYVRELRPYMYWLGHLQTGRQAGELDWQAIGGTWGSATSRLSTWRAGDALAGHGRLNGACLRIRRTSDTLASYVERYFVGIREHCAGLARTVRPGGRICYIVGNSKFYDEVLPVEQIYADLFVEAGFVNPTVETLRKRSSKKELFEFLITADRP